MSTILLPPVLPPTVAPSATMPAVASPAVSLGDWLNRMSEDDFYLFCRRNAELKFERRADGIIEFLTMTGGTTGHRNSEMVTDLTIWNRQNRLGLVFDSSTGFRLPNGAVRSPDVAWVRAETWQALPAAQQEKFPPLCPDFVVKLVSPSDDLTAVVVKMEEYIANGCRLAWLIDPKTETARAFRADGSVSVAKTFAETLSGEDVLPGFTLALSTVR